MPSIPLFLSLYVRPLCQNLSKALDIFRKIPRTSKEGLPSKAIKMLCLVAISWCIHESPGLTPDWLALSRQLDLKNHKYSQISIFRKFYNKSAKVIQNGNYLLIVCFFLMHWNNICFFQLTGKPPSLKQLLNNKESSFITEGPQSFSILIDILSCSWALLEFKPCINLNIFFESIWTVLSLLEVSKVWIDRRVLLFGISWHCLLKKKYYI